jgi:septal ring factor EnvC (AmiA/AmiB activator)
MSFRFVALTGVLVGAIALYAPTHAAKAAVPAGPAPDWGLVRQLADAQRGLGESFQAMKDKVDALQTTLDAAKEERTALHDDLKAMRDEVKGLYVELAGVKQQIDESKTHIDEVDSNVSGFRTFSGFFIAAMLLLLVLNLTLVIRR